MQSSAGDQLSQRRTERVLGVSAVKPLITVAATGDQISGIELGQLILHGLKREMTQTRELPDIELLSGIREQQLKDPARTSGNNPCKSVFRIAPPFVSRPLKAVELRLRWCALRKRVKFPPCTLGAARGLRDSKFPDREDDRVTPAADCAGGS